MADPDSEQVDEFAENDASGGGGRSALMSKLVLVLALALVVVAECIAASFFLPSAPETAELTGMTGQTPEAENAGVMDELAAMDADTRDQVEVDLGQFDVTAFQPLSNTTMRLTFRLYGTIAREDQEAFELVWVENQHRLREQVIVTLRSSELNDLTDAGLGLIKRRILEKTNRTLGKPILRSIIFSEFSFIEQ